MNISVYPDSLVAISSLSNNASSVHVRVDFFSTELGYVREMFYTHYALDMGCFILMFSASSLRYPTILPGPPLLLDSII